MLHTWGSALTHHPHAHMIVPGGGIALDGQRWISPRPAFLLPVRVPGKLFRRLFVTRLIELHDAGRLAFFGGLAPRADRRALLRHLSPIRNKRRVVYAKPPFADPEAVLAYLSRCTHRVAVPNRRLLAFNEAGVTFRYKDYRRDGGQRRRVMTLATDEFIRRLLLHVLPRGLHRIRHHGLLASSARKDSPARARELLAVAPPPSDDAPKAPRDVRLPCPCCGGHMIIIEIFARWSQPRAPPDTPHSAEGATPRPGTDRTRPAPWQSRFGQPPDLCEEPATPSSLATLTILAAATPAAPRIESVTRRLASHAAASPQPS